MDFTANVFVKFTMFNYHYQVSSVRQFGSMSKFGMPVKQVCIGYFQNCACAKMLLVQQP